MLYALAIYWLLLALATYKVIQHRREKRWRATLTLWALTGYAEIDGHQLPLPWDERWLHDTGHYCYIDIDGGRILSFTSGRIWCIAYSGPESTELRSVAYCREVKKLYYNRTRPTR